MKKLLCANGNEATEIHNQICFLPCDDVGFYYTESIFSNYSTAAAYQFSQNQNPQTRKMLEGVTKELERVL